MAHNVRRLDEVPKEFSAQPKNFFGISSSRCWVKGDRRAASPNIGAAAARWAEGDRREPFAQRTGLVVRWGF
jgi:hypothetical protein